MPSNLISDLALFSGGTLLFIAVLVLVASAFSAIGDGAGALAWLGRKGRGSQEVKALPPSISIEDKLLSQIGTLVTPGDPAEFAATKLRLVRAGYRRPSALRVFYLARAICAFFFALIGMGIMAIVTIPLPLPILVSLLVFPVLFGFLLPPLVVDWRANQRRSEAEQSFPDVLDMLLVCIEAGQSFDQACRRVAREIRVISSVLFEEFALMNDELRAGRDRTQVFRDFAARLNVIDINAFVTVLRQSDEFGVSIADALRVYAADMRHKRLMRAEEKANLMPLKLALGSMFFTVPPTMLVMAGPSLLMIFRAFKSMGGH